MDIRTWQEADRADEAFGPESGVPEYLGSGRPGPANRTGHQSPDFPGPAAGVVDPKSYRARHRSQRSPFSPLRPAPIAIGSLSTAAVAAFALMGPLLHHTGTAGSDHLIVDGLAQRVAPLTPGPVTPSSTAPEQDSA